MVPPGAFEHGGGGSDEEEAGGHRERILVKGVENLRGEESDKGAAGRAAEGGAEIELGETVGGGAEFVKAAVAGVSTGAESEEVRADHQGKIQTPVQRRLDHDEKHAENGKSAPGDGADFKAGREGEDIAEEIDRERKNPEKRNCGDVEGDGGGGAQGHCGGRGGEADPEEATAPGHRIVGYVRCDDVHFGAAAAKGAGTGSEYKNGQERVADGPDFGLTGEHEVWFDQEGEAEEAEKASGVAGGIEEVRIVCSFVVGRAKPGLEQGAGSGDSEVGKTCDERESDEKPGGRSESRTGNPTDARKTDGQREQHEAHEQSVDAELGREAQLAGDNVRIEVTEEEHGLEEDHGGVPDVGRSSEDGEDELCRHRLDEEKQDSGEEDGGAEDEYHKGSLAIVDGYAGGSMNTNELRRFDAIICDIDGCLGPESHYPLDAEALAKIAEHNVRACKMQDVPVVTLASGRPAAFVECLCRLTANMLVPCVAENGVWLYDPRDGSFSIDPRIGAAERKAVLELTMWLESELVPKGLVIQPGKSASVSIFHEDTSYLMALMPRLREMAKERGWPIRVSNTVRWINLDLEKVSKATGIARLVEKTALKKERLAGVGDSLSDLAIAERVHYFACPVNADGELKKHAAYVSRLEEIEGVLDILARVSTKPA